MRIAAMAIVVGLACASAEAAPKPGAKKSPKDQAAEAGKIELKAKTMMDRGVELLEMGQVERGVKLVTSVPRMFPKAKARFDAWLYLGKHYRKMSNFPLAIKSLRQIEKSKDRDQKADALYQIGICHFMMDQFDSAFTAFRKVTSDYPWSVYANEAYYYIGQCHFKLGRWSKAIEALELVGTSVPPNLTTMSFAEAGQRVFAKIYDKDLVILAAKGEPITLKATARTGDEETVKAGRLGKSGEYYLASIRTAPGKPIAADGILQFVGDDVVTVIYIDKNTKAGKIDERIVSSIKLVSTAMAGFTDGAYREYTHGVFGDKDCFIRVKDLDQDRTGERDRVRVKLRTQRTEKKHEQTGTEEDTDLDAPQEVTTVRDALEMELLETSEHSGIFVGSIVTHMVEKPEDVKPADKTISAIQGDDIVVTYVDNLHLAGEEPRTVSAKAKVLIGQLGDVRIEHRVVQSLRDKARKNLIEGKIYLKLGEIFKDVGLNKKASEKADEGLARIDDVISVHLKASLDRSVVEDAFSVKWDLLLVQDRLQEAIGVCRTLMNLFPDSTLVDQALFKIAVAKMKAGDAGGAMGIFAEVTKLKKSDLAAEAQYNIAMILETEAAARPGVSKAQAFASAMVAYQRCAEFWPDSHFAGESLGKIADYYIATKDYSRAIELMERVFVDYPDAKFLPKMLIKWVKAAYRQDNFELAKEKANQCISEYPNSPEAKTAKDFLVPIEKRLKKLAEARS